jgi:hypothetical protein
MTAPEHPGRDDDSTKEEDDQEEEQGDREDGLAKKKKRKKKYQKIYDDRLEWREQNPDLDDDWIPPKLQLKEPEFPPDLSQKERDRRTRIWETKHRMAEREFWKKENPGRDINEMPPSIQIKESGRARPPNLTEPEKDRLDRKADAARRLRKLKKERKIWKADHPNEPLQENLVGRGRGRPRKENVSPEERQRLNRRLETKVRSRMRGNWETQNPDEDVENMPENIRLLITQKNSRRRVQNRVPEPTGSQHPEPGPSGQQPEQQSQGELHGRPHDDSPPPYREAPLPPSPRYSEPLPNQPRHPGSLPWHRPEQEPPDGQTLEYPSQVALHGLPTRPEGLAGDRENRHPRPPMALPEDWMDNPEPPPHDAPRDVQDAHRSRIYAALFAARQREERRLRSAEDARNRRGGLGRG